MDNDDTGLWAQAHAKRAEAGDLAARASEANAAADELEERARATEGSQSAEQAAADRVAVAGACDRTEETVREAAKHMSPEDAAAALALLDGEPAEGASAE